MAARLAAAQPAAVARPTPLRPAPAVRRVPLPARAAAPADDDASLSGEWPANWSIASYEDVGAYFQAHVFKDAAAPDTPLGEIMSTNLKLATPDMTLAEAKKLFDEVTGVPVVRSASDLTLIGVLSRKDLKDRPGETVADVMSREPVACPVTAKVADAAGLMLRHKIHRIPIVNSRKECIGLVSRTDLFTALLGGGAPPP